MPSATTRFPYIKMLMVFALLAGVVSAESTEAVRSSPAFNTSTLTSNSTSAKPYLRSDAVMATSDDASSVKEKKFTTMAAQSVASSKSPAANQIRQSLGLARTSAGDAFIKGHRSNRSNWELEDRTSTEVFKLLELDKSGEQFLNNPLLSAWSHKVTSSGFDDPTAVMIETVSETIDKSLLLKAVARARDQDSELVIMLREAEFKRLLDEHKTLEGVEKELFKPTRRYDDQDLAMFLVGVKDVESTKPLMTRLVLEWMRKRKTSTEVFKLLGLDKSGEKFLNSPLLSLWSRYVTSRGFVDPTAVMIRTVSETIDKSLLLKAVARARDQDSELVIRLRKELFERLLAEHKTLEGVENELFKPTRRYDDQDLAKFLVGVKDVENTKPLMTRLVKELAHKGRTSTEVFKLLELDKSGEHFLNNLLASTWSRYVTSSGFDDPTAVMIKTVSETIDKSLLLKAVARARDQDSELVIMLREAEFERLLAEHKTLEGVEKELFKPTRRYDDQDLAKFLVGVKDVESTKPLMTRLEQEWARKRKTSTEVFELLGLDKSGENFLNSPLLSLWSRYVTSSGFDDPTAVMIKTVSETIDKSLLLKAVARARDQDSELVIRLRKELFERLLAEHKTLEGVENELPEPTRYYDDQDLAKFLVGVKDVESTKPLMTRLEQEWALKRKTSTEVFELLGLDKSGENFLNSPLLSLWSRYVTSRGSNDPTTVMIETVTKAIKDKSLLLGAVIQAREQDSELVIRLRDKAFERLLAEETLEKVEKELSKFTDEAGKKALYRFQKFYGKRKAEPISKGDASIKNNGIHIN